MSIIDSLKLQGKTALITGGSQGIGKAITLALAEAGADVVINYRSDKNTAIRTQKQVTDLGVHCYLNECDLVETDAPLKIVAFLEKNQLAPDILVLNASVQIRKEWDQVTPEEFATQINVNFRASLFLVQKIYPMMQQKKWGRIVTVGSVQQSRPHPHMIVYAASKMAQLSMVKSLAPQFAPYGVTINNLAPGAIYTKRNETVLHDQDYKAKVEAGIPAGYIGEPQDCAATALLLCSEGGRYITGQDIFVDGGMGLSS